MLPDLADLTADAHVVALPMRVRFRGITIREALVLRGPAGWTEFSPFVEYDDAEATAWLRAAIDFGWTDHEPAADSVPVNATVPAVPADRVAEVLARYPGCTTAKVKVAEPGTTLEDDVDRVTAVRRVMGPDAAVRVDANGLWTVDQAVRALEPSHPSTCSTPNSRSGPSPSSPTSAAGPPGSGSRSPPTRASVAPPIPSRWHGPALPTSWS